MIFQDPYASLNPWRTVARIVSESLLIQGSSVAAARRRAAEPLDLVGPDPEHLDRHPHQPSGGQAQRIGIARAPATGPRSSSPSSPSPRSTSPCRPRFPENG
ncbi:hypothetical protein GCM10010406_15540 [Streptomyces thermolineatus]|uniref:Uncharacterized protein n=1 Tax=Streptomyces thermolineatus TaxID=44033 RepID=A0ABN3L9E8_9ACTN